MLLPDPGLLLRSEDCLADLLGDGPGLVGRRKSKVAEVLNGSAMLVQGLDEADVPERPGRMLTSMVRQSKRRGKS